MLKFYENSLLERKGKKKSKMQFTFRECVFLSGESLNDRFYTREIKFKIGDSVTFFHLPATVTDVMIDDENRIIYRIECNNGLITTSVQQEILLAEKKKENDSEEIGVENEKNSVPLISEPIVEVEKSIPESEMPDVTPDIFAPKIEVAVRPIDYISQLGNSQKFSPTFLGSADEPKMEDVINFLKLESYSSSFTILINVMKIYKFMVQNPFFDMTILRDKGSLNLSDIDQFSDNLVLSFAFQHFLSKAGIQSDIVMLKNGITGEKRATVGISTSKNEFFFDVAGERFLRENNFPTISTSPVSMAYIGSEAYEPYFQPVGIFSEEKMEVVPSDFSKFSKRSIEPMIIKGIDREVKDMIYPLEKRK